MLKKLGLSTTVLLSAILLNGCGSEDSKSDIEKLKDKSAIEIYHNVQSASGCSAENFPTNPYIDPIFYILDNTATCQNTFGRPLTSDLKGTYCREYDSEDGGNNACVVGFEDFRASANKELIINLSNELLMYSK